MQGLRERGILTQDVLPARIRSLYERLTREGDWLPEVAHVTAMLALRDTRFGRGVTANSAFVEWLAQLNRELFGAAPHAEAFSVETPRDVVTRLPAVWELFHRGTPMHVISCLPKSAHITIDHPRVLFAPISIESHRRAFAILLAKTGAVAPEITTTTTDASKDLAQTSLHASWR